MKVYIERVHSNGTIYKDRLYYDTITGVYSVISSITHREKTITNNHRILKHVKDIAIDVLNLMEQEDSTENTTTHGPKRIIFT